MQNGHTHNNNFAAFAAELLLCVWPFFYTVGTKGLKLLFEHDLWWHDRFCLDEMQAIYKQKR